ncbi:MAG: IS481 family transposase [Candidatus Eisenbacteria bacterium]|nr:IS481 family transposase [Candidatus Eisenbacteria bacterium]
MDQNSSRIIRNKLGLLNLAEELGNVSKACRVMGVSRDTFYRYRAAREEGGVEALLEKTRRKPNPKNRVDEEIEKAVLEFCLEFPAHGQVRVSNDLRKQGVFVSPSGVRCIWIRNKLQNRKLRLRAMEAKVAAEGGVLTEAQVVALEKQRSSDVAHGEIETEHPGYLGSQDTYYVGTIKGIGRIYQQTFVDTHCKVAAAKLYTMKTPITAADLLNDRVLPMLEAEGFDLLRILTDRGSEFCGRPERHDYQLYLAINGIEHTRTKAYSPQTNGICERFQRTVKEEFYDVTFRKKVYSDLETLQADLDAWIDHYNNERTHQGKMCCGRTPMQTMRDARSIWEEKVVALN